MKDYIEERAKELAKHCIENKATVREMAKVFSVSKSTVHKDLAERLKKIDSHLYEQVQIVLQYNKDARHIRGGEATRRKYLRMKRSQLY